MKVVQLQSTHKIRSETGCHIYCITYELNMIVTLFINAYVLFSNNHSITPAYLFFSNNHSITPAYLFLSNNHSITPAYLFFSNRSQIVPAYLFLSNRSQYPASLPLFEQQITVSCQLTSF